MAFKLIEAAEGPLALRQRRASRRARARRSDVPKGGVGRERAAGRGGRRVISGSGRSTTLDYSSSRSHGDFSIAWWGEPPSRPDAPRPGGRCLRRPGPPGISPLRIAGTSRPRWCFV
jgi:hypothetical protein